MDQVSFGPFSLDLESTRLTRNGIAVDLRPQALQALKILLFHGGRNVEYEQMIREAWDGTLVSRHTVAVTVGEVKKALEEYGCWISYRPKLGYRLEVPRSEDLLRRGWHFLNQTTRDGFERAIDCFEKAAAEDSADPRPLEGLSRGYLTLGCSGMRPPRQMHRAFLDTHGRAVALRGMTPELRSDWGHALHMFERRLFEAETEQLRAIKDEPRLATSYVRLTMLYTAQGRLDEALDVLEQAKSVDPLCPMAPATEIAVRFCRREFKKAVECGREALELHPYIQIARVFHAQALEYVGRVEEALAHYRLACVISPDFHWLRALEGACLARHGSQTKALAVLRKLQQTRATDYVDGYYVALLLEALGKREAAFGELERAFEERSSALTILSVDPKMDGMRSDSRFANFIDRLFCREQSEVTRSVA
jgi:tetratricopeptide (TPR) repeat protein